MSDLIDAQVVFDGQFDVYVMQHVSIPKEMGQPRADQMQGTVFEQLAELAGRVCYDSLGKGRNSAGFHKHIIEVAHLSVYEHVNFTVEIRPYESSWLPGGEFERERLLPHFLNRPSLFVRLVDRHAIRVTLNVRHILEWTRGPVVDAPWYWTIADGLLRILRVACPQISAQVASLESAVREESVKEQEGPRRHDLPFIQLRHVAAETDDEHWVSLYLSGSRGFSHEQVRHGDWTGISQQSTRYCDESESPWVEHPLEAAYSETLSDVDDHDELALFTSQRDEAIAACQALYIKRVEHIEDWLVQRGVDKLTARKQARGVARGYLGNALQTTLIFSANVAQWGRMLLARCSAAADAEIRAVYVRVLREMQGVVATPSLLAFELSPSPDGIGEIATLAPNSPEKRDQILRQWRVV